MALLAASNLFQLADVLNQISFLLALGAFQTFQSSAFSPASRPKRSTLKWKGPRITGNLNSPAPDAPHAGGASWGPTTLEARQTGWGLNPQWVCSGCNSTKLHMSFVSYLGNVPKWRQNGHIEWKVIKKCTAQGNGQSPHAGLGTGSS